MKVSPNVSKKLSPGKYALLTGTILLTSAGLITSVLGFFYSIFLSRTIGAEGLGIFNMVHPVFGICFGLCAGSIQTAISRSVAANVKKGRSIFRTGLVISVAVSFLLANSPDERFSGRQCPAGAKMCAASYFYCGIRALFGGTRLH